MIQQVLSRYDLPLLSVAGLLLFFGVFTGVLLWTLRRGSREFYAGLESLPLYDGVNDGEKTR